jgi:nitrite reductase (NADH) large subunit
MEKEKLVLVGNGMAGMRTLEELLKTAPDMYDITVFGSEPYGNYNRILLSPVLAGEKAFPDILLNDEPWYAANGITLHKNCEVTGIDRRARKVVARDGTTAEYDRLLLATGSHPFILPVPGSTLPGVITFRDMNDVDTMISASKSLRHAVVIGGGLLGLEAANGLKQRGMHVTVACCTARSKSAAWNFCSARKPKRSSARSACRACASRTGAKPPPTSWSWRWAYARTSISRKNPAFTASAASS